jgi:hypothetical protein
MLSVRLMRKIVLLAVLSEILLASPAWAWFAESFEIVGSSLPDKRPEFNRLLSAPGEGIVGLTACAEKADSDSNWSANRLIAWTIGRQ